ncbi:MAG: cupin domain-containing protein, partial [Steroidobacteraceae bacterium]
TPPSNAHGLNPDPIPSDWILEGHPLARSKRLVGSSDDMASTHMWDCTAGRFNWFYTVDEVIHVIEGSVTVEDPEGVSRQLQAGDTFLFPAGTRFHWTVPQYIRKIAFLHSPLSRKLRIAKRIFQVLKSPFRSPQAPSSGFRA